MTKMTTLLEPEPLIQILMDVVQTQREQIQSLTQTNQMLLQTNQQLTSILSQSRILHLGSSEVPEVHPPDLEGDPDANLDQENEATYIDNAWGDISGELRDLDSGSEIS